MIIPDVYIYERDNVDIYSNKDSKMKVTVKDDTYEMIIDLLKDIKLTQGNIALNSTLNRHPDIKRYLLDTQISSLQELEDILKSE